MANSKAGRGVDQMMARNKTAPRGRTVDELSASKDRRPPALDQVMRDAQAPAHPPVPKAVDNDC